MTRGVKCWSFLVSRNLDLGYRTIVAPNFLCDARMTGLVARAAGGDITQSETAIYRQILNSDLGDLTLVFRVIESRCEDMGIECNGIIKDSFGREIRLIEGFVFQDNLPLPDIEITQDDFEQLHHQLKEHYRNFWKLDKPEPAIPSESYVLQAKGEALKLITQEPYLVNAGQPLLTPKPSLSNSWAGSVFKQFQSEIISVIFSIDGKSLLVRCDENNKQTVWLFSRDRNIIERYFLGEKIPFFPHPTPAVISPNGQYTATAMIGTGDINIIKVWNISNGQETSFEISKIGTGHQNRVNVVTFINNETLISCGEDKKLYFWDLKSKGKSGELSEHLGDIKAIAYNFDNLLASGDTKGTIIIWELYSNKISALKKYKIKAHGTPNESPVTSLVFSPDGKILASAGDDCQIKLWNPSKGENIGILGQHSVYVNTIVFNPNGKILASGDDQGLIKIWDVHTKQSIYTLTEHRQPITSLSFSSDGKILASGSKDGTIRLWTHS